MSECCVILKQLSDAIDWVNHWIGKTVSWLTLLMVLTTALIVLLRYVFDIGWIALQEAVTYMHALVFMLGAAYTLKADGHVRVDIFYQRCNTKIRAWIDCLGTLFLLLPVSLFIVWSSWDYVIDSWSIHEGSRNSGGLPGLYLLKSSMIVMGGLLVLQGVSMFLRNLLTALGHDAEERSDG